MNSQPLPASQANFSSMMPSYNSLIYQELLKVLLQAKVVEDKLLQ
jgi:hypothetical protein